MTRHRVLDGLVLVSGALLVAAGLVVTFVLWPQVEQSVGALAGGVRGALRTPDGRRPAGCSRGSGC